MCVYKNCLLLACKKKKSDDDIGFNAKIKLHVKNGNHNNKPESCDCGTKMRSSTLFFCLYDAVH